MAMDPRNEEVFVRSPRCWLTFKKNVLKIAYFPHVCCLKSYQDRVSLLPHHLVVRPQYRFYCVLRAGN